MSVKSAVGKSSMVQRYMIVEYSMKDRSQLGFDEKGLFKNHFPLHHMMSEYHWAHLDSNHVIVTCTFHPHHKKEIDAREDVSVLPPIHSSKAVSTSIKKVAHWKALTKAHPDVSAKHTMSDVSELLAARHGSLWMS